MGNEQINQSPEKENRLPGILFWSMLAIGLILAFLSFAIDQPVWDWIRSHEIGWIKLVSGELSNYGDWPELMVIGLVLAASAWVARSARFMKIVLCMILASSIAGGLVNSVRCTTGRPRPNNFEVPQGWYGLRYQGKWIVGKNKFNSFPSGHTGAAFGFFGVLALAIRRFGGFALIIAGAIGFSRIYLGAHHVSDVMFGMVVGLVTAYLCCLYASDWLELLILKSNRFRYHV